MKILNKYILKELIHYFFLSLFIFTSLFMFTNINKTISLMVNKSAEITEILKIFVFFIPASLYITIPSSLIISILMSLGRLSSDSELIVLKSCGVKIRQIIKPIIYFSLLMTFFSFISINFISSKSMYKARFLLKKIFVKNPMLILKSNKPIVIKNQKIKIKKISGNNIEGITIIDKNKNTITAKKGKLIFSKNNIKIVLNNGIVEKIVGKLYSKYDINKFKNLIINIPRKLNTDIKKIKLTKNSKEYSFFEFKKKIKEKLKSKNVKEYKKKQINMDLVDLYDKIILPFSCLSLAILAIPLGFSSKKTGKAIGFTWGIFSIFFYYTFLTWIKSLCLEVNILFLIKYIMLIPNIIFFSLGLYLFYRLVLKK